MKALLILLALLTGACTTTQQAADYACANRHTARDALDRLDQICLLRDEGR